MPQMREFLLHAGCPGIAQHCALAATAEKMLEPSVNGRSMSSVPKERPLSITP